MEERVYRLRCVEGWSMVIPWVGYSLSALLKQVEPTTNAKYVEFVTVVQRDNMPGVRAAVLDWPYVEGLRIDEAMHPLAMLVFGLYGRSCPIRTGRLCGWRCRGSTASSRPNRWSRSGWSKSSRCLPGSRPRRRYGFYANVNPAVPHPRWSQASERRIGEDGLFSPKRKTLPFNGYADQVAALYQGMDLKANY